MTGKAPLNHGIFQASFLLSAILAIAAMGTGCMQPLPDRAERMTRGYIYYLDGAGGGGAISNWAGGVKQGMLDAGYNGAGEIFKWNTGLGVLADQDSTVEYKRSKAAECARSIETYVHDHPGAPVTLMGLSAGTAVTVFTLEALPTSCPVENVILLGASIASDYDLTRALQRVRNRMYVFTSGNDAVLAFLVPMAGTADRQQGAASAGLNGFQTPARPSAATRTQYAKVANIRWNPAFEKAGNFGGHTDTVKAPFVQQYIAPLIMASMAKRVQVASADGKVKNPDYERWARFSPGSSITLEGYQAVKGVKQPLRMTARLVSKHQDRLVVERTYSPTSGDSTEETRVQQFLVEARIPAADHPLTSPTAKISEQPAESLVINGKSLPCRSRTVQADGDFPEYGRGVWASVCQSDALPGGMARVWLKSSKNGEPFEFRGQVVKYQVQ
jgi:pimeloyl-ACP methyl ester carboxylesterase